jgi:hypothetical protein
MAIPLKAVGPTARCEGIIYCMTPTDVTSTLRVLEWSLAAVLSILVMVALMRWARRGGRGTALVGSALVLLLGIGLVPEQIPEQRIEEAREEKGKKGSPSGPPLL